MLDGNKTFNYWNSKAALTIRAFDYKNGIKTFRSVYIFSDVEKDVRFPWL